MPHSFPVKTFVIIVMLFCQGFSLYAQVGYSMRGNTQPFHNWDSSFNPSGRSKSNSKEGFVLKLGSLNIRPNFGAGAGYDNNVFLLHDNYVDDSYYSIAPGIMLVYGTEDNNYLTMNYVYEDIKYSEESELDYDSHLFSLGANYILGHCILHLSDQFSNTRETDAETFQNLDRSANIETFTVDRYISRKSSLKGEQRYEIYDYDLDQYIDYNEFWYGGYFSHQTFPKIKTLIGGGYGMVRMNDDVMGDADYLELNIGLQGRLTAKTQLHLRGGFQTRKFKDDIEDINEWTALIGLTSRYSRRTYWGVDLSRRLSPSSTQGGYTRVSTSISPYIRHIFGKDHFSISVSGSYEPSDYYGPQGELDRHDTLWYINGGVDLSLFGFSTVGAGCTYTKQIADDEINEYDDTVVYLRAMLNY